MPGIPLYKEVRDQIVQSLVKSEWQPGDPIPSEKELSKRYAVAISTVRAAISELVASDILIRKQGKGTFVAHHSSKGSHYRFFNVVRNNGGKKAFNRRLLSIRKEKADADAIRTFGLRPARRGGDVYRMRIKLSTDGPPFAYAEVVLPVHLFPTLEDDGIPDGPESLYALYQERYGVNTTASRRTSTRSPRQPRSRRRSAFPPAHRCSRFGGSAARSTTWPSSSGPPGSTRAITTISSRWADRADLVSFSGRIAMGTYDEWVGRVQRDADTATAAPPRLLAATLNREQIDFPAGAVLPQVWHWLYFLPAVRTRDMAKDGHPPRGGFLPPVPLPRRMRAGGAFRFEHPIRVGDALERQSRIASVSEKKGSTGPLVFVRVEHEISANGRLAVVEEESIVYREAATPGAQPAAASATRRAPAALPPGASRFPTDPVLLFRTSALTFNSHRIHYDLDYAVREEAYPERVVHGPLIALFMLEHLHSRYPADRLRQFKYRAMAPTFCGEDVSVSETGDGKQAAALQVIARNGSGAEAVTGDATYGG